MGFFKKEMKEIASQTQPKKTKLKIKREKKNLYFKINEELKKKSCFG